MRNPDLTSLIQRRKKKMHRLAKKLSILLAALLTFTALAAIRPTLASSGNILIETDTPPSSDITISIGENVSLYFKGVTWSGGQVDLYLSGDGYASLTIPGDVRYGPTFSVADITDTATPYTQIKEGDLRYTVGNYWINGTVPEALEIPGGKYWVKAFDGATAAVAVTDNYFTIRASMVVKPSFGPGQAAIKIYGYSLPANDYANLSYIVGTVEKTIQNLVPADDLGKFTYSMLAPDLMMPKTTAAGLQSDTIPDVIKFHMVVNSTGQDVYDTFDEYRRGLKQIKGVDRGTAVTAPDGWLYGNGTTFAVDVTVKGDMVIVGFWFHPGTLTILLDMTTTMGTVVANSTHGYFNTTVEIPVTKKGLHNVTIDDGKTIFWFKINVVPTLILIPDVGPTGITVTAYGYGFPESDATPINVTLWWDFTDACDPVSKNLTVVQTDTNGYFVTTFTVPTSVGGKHVVNGTADDDPINPTWAYDTFTVKATLSIIPSDFTNDGTEVTVSGSGLAYDGWYDLCLDNVKDFYSANVMIDLGRYMFDDDDKPWYEYESAVTSYFQPNCTGYVEFEFVAAGFQPGTHVVTLYKLVKSHQLPVIEDFVLFTVWEETPILDKLDEVMDKLDDIDAAVTELDFSGLADDIDDIISELAALPDIQADLGSVISMLTDIKAIAETAANQATEAATEAGSANTSASAAEDAAEAANATVSGISTAVYGAIILSLVAALASIVAVITLQRKVA
jgi:hypothetical protein